MLYVISSIVRTEEKRESARAFSRFLWINETAPFLLFQSNPMSRRGYVVAWAG